MLKLHIISYRFLSRAMPDSLASKIMTEEPIRIPFVYGFYFMFFFLCYNKGNADLFYFS